LTQTKNNKDYVMGVAHYHESQTRSHSGKKII